MFWHFVLSASCSEGQCESCSGETKDNYKALLDTAVRKPYESLSQFLRSLLSSTSCCMLKGKQPFSHFIEDNCLVKIAECQWRKNKEILEHVATYFIASPVLK